MPKIDVASDLPKLEKRVDALEKGVKKLASMQKKKYAEFETLNNALYEGKDVIEDNRKKLKKEKNAKKIKLLADEIDAQETTFGKISKKIPALRKSLDDMSGTAKNLCRSLDEELGNISKMEKALARTGGDVKELKAMGKTLKGLTGQVKDAAEPASLIADTGLPNTPKL